MNDLEILAENMSDCSQKNFGARAMKNFKYQIGFIGQAGAHRSELEKLLNASFTALGLSSARIAYFDEADIAANEPKAPLIAVFFGYPGATDAAHPCLSTLINDSITVIPCVDSTLSATLKLPPCLHHINALPLNNGDTGLPRLASLILENLRLLRSERRLFISYRRAESQSIAIQLYETLDAAGFDVFLDSRSVPFGTDFQGILWHRMADSDVVVLLDTPGFRQSSWAVKEMTQANATNVQILHLLWPGVNSDPASAFSQFLPLKSSDFKSPDLTGERASFSDQMRADVSLYVESLRARALASRHRSLIDNFCDRAREERVAVVSVQPQRFISIEFASGRKIAVVPTIGVPSAVHFHDIETVIQELPEPPEKIWLLYDERGILDKWVGHLDWLNKHLPVVSVQITKCSERLQGGVP